MFSANSSQVSDDKLFVEDVFSTYLYRGNGTTQTITNGIDLAGKGGMVWIKNRTTSSDPLHYLNFRDGSDIVSNNSNNTSAKQVMTPYAAFNSDGFFVNALPGFLNNSGVNYASWTFREAPKFFDVVTYTGDGNYSTGASRAIPHSLGVQPGIVFIKRTDSTGEWWTAARRTGSTQWFGSTDSSTPFALNRTNAASTYNGTSQVYADATSFYPAWIGAGGSSGTTNNNGATYVAYLFAHDATSDGIIQCGSLTANNNNPVVTTLGWEPQWLMFKNTAGGNWQMVDNMRGLVNGSGNDDAQLFPDSTSDESLNQIALPTATGFNSTFFGTDTYIYIAIRRGPMRTPTLGTSVYNAIATTGTGTNSRQITGYGFNPDFLIFGPRSQSGYNRRTWDRLRNAILYTDTTASEAAVGLYAISSGALQGGYIQGTSDSGGYNQSGTTWVNYGFGRAPGFFDTVCYTGDNTTSRELNHNLGVVPEMVIVKCRSSTTDGNFSWGAGWWTAVKGSGATGYWFLPSQSSSGLNSSNASGYSDVWSGYFPSATTFNPYYATLSGGSEGTGGNVSGKTYVSYLFASCPGVSKVGSYTGNGSSQTINCGFAAGARFVMIKRTDSTGDWFVWDSARGIVAGNDPYLALNNTDAEVTSNDTIDTDSSGFVVNQVGATNVNVSSATYIYLAIA